MFAKQVLQEIAFNYISGQCHSSPAVFSIENKSALYPGCKISDAIFSRLFTLKVHHEYMHSLPSQLAFNPYRYPPWYPLFPLILSWSARQLVSGCQLVSQSQFSASHFVSGCKLVSCCKLNHILFGCQLVIQKIVVSQLASVCLSLCFFRLKFILSIFY